MGDVDTIVQRPLKDQKQGKEGWKRYDTKHSPFLELQTPFTGWWLLCPATPHCRIAPRDTAEIFQPTLLHAGRPSSCWCCCPGCCRGCSSRCWPS